MNLGPLHWELRVLTTGPAGKSLSLFLKCCLFIFGCAGSLLLHGLSSPVAVSGGYSLVAVHGLLIVVASTVVEHGLLGTWAH